MSAAAYYDSQQAAPLAGVPGSAREAAQVLGTGLVQVIVTSIEERLFYIFLNGVLIPGESVDSFLLQVQNPSPTQPEQVISAQVCYYNQALLGGARSLTVQQLFPCTVDVLLPGKRVTVTNEVRNDPARTWVSLGLCPDGRQHELVHGVQALQFLIDAELGIVCTITWQQGDVEDLTL